MNPHLLRDRELNARTFTCKWCGSVERVVPATIYKNEAGDMRAIFGSVADFCSSCEEPREDNGITDPMPLTREEMLESTLKTVERQLDRISNMHGERQVRAAIYDLRTFMADERMEADRVR